MRDRSGNCNHAYPPSQAFPEELAAPTHTGQRSTDIRNFYLLWLKAETFPSGSLRASKPSADSAEAGGFAHAWGY